VAEPLYPLVEVAIEPKTRADQEKLGRALARIVQDDPTFGVTIDHESGQTLIKGMSELHLEMIVDRLKREFEVEANVGAPQVAYHETITRRVEQDYTHKKRTGGSGQFARVKIRFEPLPAGSGFVFENAVVDASVPRQFVPGVEKGMNAAKETGVIAGFPLIDFKATLVDGAYDAIDSNVLTFDIAARACFREGIPKAGPKLLEPIMDVEVVTPEDRMGDVIGDLNGRRGQVYAMDTRGSARVVNAMVPLASLFGYTSDLARLTQRRPSWTMRFSHYEQVPQSAPDDDPRFPPAVGMRA
jgi:elongation factor G